MLTGRSYEDVLNDQIRMVGDLDAALRLRLYDWRVYLSYLGFETGMYEAEGVLLDGIPEFPKGVRCLCGVGTDENHPKYSPDNSHAIILDETGIVFDPLVDAPGVHALEHYRIAPSKLLLVVSVHDRRLLK
jgi:hypothetical protein